MPTADAVRTWVEELRPAFPWFEDPDRAAAVWLNSAAEPLRPDRWLDAAREASLDPRRVSHLADRWLGEIAEHLGVPRASVLPGMGVHVTIERVLALLDLRGPGRYLVTPDVHAAVMNGLELLYAKGRGEIVPLPLDSRGRLELDGLAESLSPDVRAVLLPHVSSVSGTRHEVAAAAAMVRDHRDRTGAATILVVDGAQSAPRLPVDASVADVYVLASQKAGGFPGAVVTANDAARFAMAPGVTDLEEATQLVHLHLAAGTVHVESLGALAGALRFLDRLPSIEEGTPAGMPSVAAAIGLLRDRLLGRLREIDGVEPLFVPEEPDENAGIVSFTLPGRPAPEVGRALEARGIHVRAAVRDDRGQYYHVPLATRMLPWLDERGGALRASPWITNVPEEIDRLADALGEIAAG